MGMTRPISDVGTGMEARHSWRGGKASRERKDEGPTACPGDRTRQGWRLGQKRNNPYHCAVCRFSCEPGGPGGDPASALGVPSSGPNGRAHRAVLGLPVLRLLAQQSLPHHAHGRGSGLLWYLSRTLTHAVPRCKFFPIPAAPLPASTRPPALGERYPASPPRCSSAKISSIRARTFASAW